MSERFRNIGVSSAQLALKANVAQEAWVTPTLINNWEEYEYTPKFRKTQFGEVCFSGGLTGGTADTVAFVLPEEYRPSTSQYFTGYSTSFARFSVSINGNVLIKAIGTYVFLDQVRFFID